MGSEMCIRDSPRGGVHLLCLCRALSRRCVCLASGVEPRESLPSLPSVISPGDGGWGSGADSACHVHRLRLAGTSANCPPDAECVSVGVRLLCLCLTSGIASCESLPLPSDDWPGGDHRLPLASAKPSNVRPADRLAGARLGGLRQKRESALLSSTLRLKSDWLPIRCSETAASGGHGDSSGRSAILHSSQARVRESSRVWHRAQRM